jgi:hypothetical protein
MMGSRYPHEEEFDMVVLSVGLKANSGDSSDGPAFGGQISTSTDLRKRPPSNRLKARAPASL